MTCLSGNNCMVKHTAVMGVQWGDEGKGKIVDALSPEHDVVVRYCGGANAGHTVVVNGAKFALHLVPSGVLRSGKVCVLANGMVVDPDALAQEIFMLAENYGLIYVSDRAHVVLQRHKDEDAAEEQKTSIGTTKKGIGPCYRDKIYRKGLRFCDDWKNHFNLHTQHYVGSLITDTRKLLQEFLDANKKILFEGGQGALLDIDHGTYPYVTSSSTGVGGIYTGTGICPKELKVIGVMKAYTTRVGGGPFPTEQLLSVGNYLREKGKEFGTTTGRPRRCGWFDGVSAKYAVQVNGVDEIALTKLDVLSGLDEILACTSYDVRESITSYKIVKTINDSIPANVVDFASITPHYLAVEGWKKDISKVRCVEDLPKQARHYIEVLETLVDRPITYVGVGQEREQLIRRS